MSKLETNTIDTVSGTSTLQVGSTNTSTITLGVSGDTINVPSGVTIANSGTATGFAANTPAFRAYMGTTQTISNTQGTKLNYNSESYDTGSNYDTSNYRFTPTTGGKYFVSAAVRLSGVVTLTNTQLYIYKNGSVYNRSTQGFNGDSSPMIINTDTVEMNGSSDYIEMYFYHNQGSDLVIAGSSENCWFNSFKIIGA